MAELIIITQLYVCLCLLGSDLLDSCYNLPIYITGKVVIMLGRLHTHLYILM